MLRLIFRQIRRCVLKLSKPLSSLSFGRGQKPPLPSLLSDRRAPCDKVILEAVATLPLGVELLRSLRYKLRLEKGEIDFLVLRLHIPQEKERALITWQKNFQSSSNTSVFISRVEIYYSITRQIRRLAKGARLLTREHLGRIAEVLDHFNGSAPEVNTQHVLIPGHIPSVFDRSYVTIDAQETLDREDAIYARELPGGEILLSVAIVDITWLFEPGSYIDLYAQRLGATVYGKKRVISTLGRGISATLASLFPGEERCAWITDIKIRGDGSGELFAKPYRARIKVAEHFDRHRLNTAFRTQSVRPMLSLALEAALRLERARRKTRVITRVKGEGLSDMIVAQSMLAAKHAFGTFLDSHKNAPAIYRVHALPSNEDKCFFSEQLLLLGIQTSPPDFDDPLQFAQILSALQQRSFLEASGIETPLGAGFWAEHLLNVFLIKSRYDHVNRGHYALNLDAYVPIKPRDAAGITNQFQLRACCEPEHPPLTEQEIRSRARNANRKLARHERVSFRLRFFEMLERKLDWIGRCYPATVVEKKHYHLLIEVPEFSRWGVLPGDPKRFSLGEQFEVRLEGFSLETMRFEFSKP
jgi:hypothetical protein